MAGTVVFQVGSLATPGPGIVVGQDDVGGTAWQYVKLDVGPAGVSRPVSYNGGTGVPVQGVGTFQALGTVQPLAGSVHIASTGTLPLGTVQVLGTTQPLAGSVHLASGLPGTAQVLGSVQAVGTTQTKEVRSTTPVGTRIAGTIGNLILLQANPARLGASFYVEMGSALFLKHGSSSGTFDYTVQVNAGALYEVPFNYSGTISGIWAFASGTVVITEDS